MLRHVLFKHVKDLQRHGIEGQMQGWDYFRATSEETFGSDWWDTCMHTHVRKVNWFQKDPILVSCTCPYRPLSASICWSGVLLYVGKNTKLGGFDVNADMNLTSTMDEAILVTHSSPCSTLNWSTSPCFQVVNHGTHHFWVATSNFLGKITVEPSKHLQ